MDSSGTLQFYVISFNLNTLVPYSLSKGQLSVRKYVLFHPPQYEIESKVIYKINYIGQYWQVNEKKWFF